jgi:hypothetical protein
MGKSSKKLHLIRQEYMTGWFRLESAILALLGSGCAIRANEPLDDFDP